MLTSHLLPDILIILITRNDLHYMGIQTIQVSCCCGNRKKKYYFYFNPLMPFGLNK